MVQVKCGKFFQMAQALNFVDHVVFEPNSLEILVGNECLNLSDAFEMQVKFGEEYNDENDELLILPHGEHSFNISQILYELVVLSIPPKLTGPNAGNGVEDFIEEDGKESTDPRWDQLKNLLNNK